MTNLSLAQFEALSVLHAWPDVSARVERWSVAQKYDLSVEDFSFSLSEFVSQTTSRRSLADLTRGWAAAVLRVSVPEVPAVIRSNRYPFSIAWTVDELRALVSAHWGSSTVGVLRIDGDEIAQDPQSVHRIIEYLVGTARDSVVLEFVDARGGLTTEVVTSIGTESVAEQTKLVLSTVNTWGEIVVRHLSYVQRAARAEWSAGEYPRSLWVPTRDASARSFIDRFVSPAGEDFNTWAAASSRSGSILCSAVVKILQAASSSAAYPCYNSDYSSSTP